MLLLRSRINSFNFLNSKLIISILVLFLLVFPKGGIKIAGIPLTWGYLLLGFFSLVALLRIPIFVSRDRIFAFLCIVPFQVFSVLTMSINGINQLGATVSFYTTFFFLPFVFFILFSKNIETLDSNFFFKIFKKGVLWISIYGIFLFITKQVTGKFLEIPLLTVNLGDWGELEGKHIDRGVVFKLISTYNNGNIFGVCLLILLPLYCCLESSSLRKFIVKFSLFLTFSRTVWFGLLFHELCYSKISNKNLKRWLTTIFITLGTFSVCIAAIMSYYGFAINFLTDTNLGGRNHSLNSLTTIGLFSKEPFSQICEIVYAGIVISFGWLGLPLFLFGMGAPLLYQVLSRRLTFIHKSIALGLFNYLFVATSDGAILFLPTMAFYWFLLSLLHRKELSYSSESRAIQNEHHLDSQRPSH